VKLCNLILRTTATNNFHLWLRSSCFAPHASLLVASLIAAWGWRSEEHLRNGEGGEGGLGERGRRLVDERTGGKCNTEECKVFLLTNLAYFGYVFNPVSFYYIVGRGGELVCVVAEVSNTPWLEQHAYVLHGKSVDVSEAKR